MLLKRNSKAVPVVTIQDILNATLENDGMFMVGVQNKRALSPLEKSTFFINFMEIVAAFFLLLHLVSKDQLCSPSCSANLHEETIGVHERQFRATR